MPDTFDHRVYVRFDHGAPEHPKVAAMSDAAFRAWFNAICWSSRQEQDGVIPAPVLARITRPKVIEELLRIGSIVARDDDTYEIHDYLDFQRARTEIAALRDARTATGTKGNHQRWHVARRRPDPGCVLCQQEGRLALAR